MNNDEIQAFIDKRKDRTVEGFIRECMITYPLGIYQPLENGNLSFINSGITMVRMSS